MMKFIIERKSSLKRSGAQNLAQSYTFFIETPLLENAPCLLFSLLSLFVYFLHYHPYLLLQFFLHL